MAPAVSDPSLASHLARIEGYVRDAGLADPAITRPDLRATLSAHLRGLDPGLLEAWIAEIGPALDIPADTWPGILVDQRNALERWAHHIQDPNDRRTYQYLHEHTRQGFIAQFPASRFLAAQMRLVRVVDADLRRAHAADPALAHALCTLLQHEFEVRVLHITDFFVEGREERLLQQEAAYQRAIEYAPSCVIMADAADGRIFLANRSAVGLLGWERHELEDRPLLDLVAPAERTRGEALLRDAEAQGHATRDGIGLRTRDGHTIRVIATIGYLDYGDRRWLQLMCTDVSERERLEGQLVQSEKMAAIGALAAGIAHELRNPLAIVMNALFDLRQLLASASSAVLEDLVIAEEEITRAQAIIKNLLEFSRESGAEIERVDVNDLVSRTLQLMQKSLQNAGVRVAVDLGPVPPCVANANAMRQIVLNLVTNAVQAMPRGGDLVLRTSRPSPERVRLEVQDTGVGIPTQHLHDIFNPFYTTKAPGQGTGLGLSVVHSILQRYRGEIRVESAVGVGTTFTIDLPCPCHDDAAPDGRAA